MTAGRAMTWKRSGRSTMSIRKWRELNHSAGLCGDDAGLNIFKPKYFMISGVPSPKTKTDPRVVINAKVGQRILIRHLNASYSMLCTRIMGLDATIYGADGARSSMRIFPGPSRSSFRPERSSRPLPQHDAI